jgi:branched-chain amino acid transport system ATP-binding protein
MEVILDVAERCVVLDFGVKIADSSPDEIIRDHRVIQAYLGDEGP